MECYEGATMIKTFRGKIADGGQDTIVLHTNDGSTGYRIVKFQIWPADNFGTANMELVGKITKTFQTTVDDAFNFDDQNLLAGAYFPMSTDTRSGAESVVFDGMIFNQDIYVSMVENAGSQPGNYYLELEQVKLNLDESTVATLKDVRNTALPAQI